MGAAVNWHSGGPPSCVRGGHVNIVESVTESSQQHYRLVYISAAAQGDDYRFSGHGHLALGAVE